MTCQEIVVRLSGVWEGISLEIIGLWCHLGFPTQCTALLCSILCTIYPSFQIDAQNARQLLSPDLFPSFYQRMWCTFRECHSESVNPSLLLQHLIYYKTSPSCINWTSPKLPFGVTFTLDHSKVKFCWNEVITEPVFFPVSDLYRKCTGFGR